MPPIARFVARPQCSVTLSACKRGAGEDEWPLCRPQIAQAFVCRSAHEHSIDIVNLVMTGRLTFIVMTVVERHCSAGDVENRRLVHVIPDSGDSGIQEIGVQTP